MLSSEHEKNKTKNVRNRKTVDNSNDGSTIPKLTKPNISPEISAVKSSNKLKPYCNKKIDKAGVKRIYSPFNKFTIQKNKMPYNSYNHATGLNYKERSYILCSCQERDRYSELKHLANHAIKNSKIFFILGPCNVIRNELVSRGWVERISANKMNLSKVRDESRGKQEISGEVDRLMLSHLVEKFNPSFVWYTSKKINYYKATDTAALESRGALINRLQIDPMWTTKQGLSSSIKRDNWFYIEDIAEVHAPRTYNTNNVEEVEDFTKDFKFTACTNLLKWVLYKTKNNQPIFIESGKIPMKVFFFAINRCKEYVYKKRNKDIDHPVPHVTAAQWNSFMKKYDRIINSEDVFTFNENKTIPLCLCYSEFLLDVIHKFRPQLSIEGFDNVWILKPTNNSRGRGIRMASNLSVITNIYQANNCHYVIQKYIEEPLLIHDTKFDIRQYYLVTSTYPIVIWMYQECYLKFSSQKYDLKNFHESVHLTNNAVQRNYVNCSGRHEELPECNMWDLETFKNYLKRIGKYDVWDNVIYSGMKKSVIGIMLSSQDSIQVSKNRFELYGCDFVLDKKFMPWLIEINSFPDLKSTTQVTAKICPMVLRDIIKVVIDYANNPNASTGNFECIYRQPMILTRFKGNHDLTIKGTALLADYFYKKPICIEESIELRDFEEELIVNSLKKLKNKYDHNILMEIKIDSDISQNLDDQDTDFKRTESEVVVL